MTQKEIFYKRLAEQQEKGLIDFGAFANPNAVAVTEEEMYAELNRMDDAPSEVNLDLFPSGKNIFTSDDLKEKDLETCIRLGINPNKNYPGFMPDLPDDEEEIKKWAKMPLEVALKISGNE